MRSTLIVHEDLYELFRERVDVAAGHRGRPISDEGVWYLADLLADRGTSEPGGPPITLAELAVQAARGDPAEAVESLRELGDEALYVSGFLRRTLARRRVGLDYYLEMGARAYDRLSRLLRAPAPPGDVPGDVEGRALDAIFEELAATFDACSDILREVQQSLFGGALDGGAGRQ